MNSTMQYASENPGVFLAKVKTSYVNTLNNLYQFVIFHACNMILSINIYNNKLLLKTRSSAYNFKTVLAVNTEIDKALCHIRFSTMAPTAVTI